MKKIIILGIISILTLTSFSNFISAVEQTGNDNIITAYSFESPIFSKININNTLYDSISINGAPCDGNPGEPMLPGKGAYILLPPNSQVSNIVVDPGEMICLGSDYLIEPAGEPIPLLELANVKMPMPDQEIYSSSDMFPGELYSEIGTYRFRGHDIFVFKLNPVQYIPASGELFYYPVLTVNVETVEETKDNSMFRGLQEDNKDVSMKVGNPNMVSTYMHTLQSTSAYLKYDLLIITSDALKSGFEPLKQAHDSNGLKTLIYTVEDIYNNYTGFDNQDKIRNFIKHAYSVYGIEYVLLGGDHEIIPARYLDYPKTSLIDSVPSDLYYACLDGDWNGPDKNPYPPNKDISINDGVIVNGKGRLNDPVIDTTNYITGGSSMLCTFNNKSGDTGSLVLKFNPPLAASSSTLKRWFRFSTNGFDNFSVNVTMWKINGEPLLIHVNQAVSYSLIEPIDSWKSHLSAGIIPLLVYKLAVFREKIAKIEIEVKLHEQVTEDDFIRFDGIYFSDTSDLIFGEIGEEDLYAEVYVGRACVDNLYDVSNFTTKTISYMNLDKIKDESYLKKVLMVGELLLEVPYACWGGDLMDNLIGKCYKYGYKTQGFPKNNNFNIDKLYDRDWEDPNPWINGWPKSEIINRINNDVHIINHAGHSYYDHNMRLDNSDVINSLNNNKLCFIYSQGCLAGGFDNPEGYDSIAEYFTVKTNKGAFAGIWNAREGFGNFLIGDGFSQVFHRHFWNAVFKENITIISKANQVSKEANIWRLNLDTATGLIYRVIYYELNYFGDPSIQFKYLDSSLTQSQSTPQIIPMQQTQPSSETSTETSHTTMESTTSSTTTTK